MEKLNGRLARFHPQEKIDTLKLRCGNSLQNLQTAMQHLLARRQQQLGNAAQLLNAVSPLGTLERGYSITFDDESKVIKSTANVKMGDRIVTRIRDGEIYSEVHDLKTFEV